MSAASRPLMRRTVAPRDGLCGITDIGLARANNEDDFYLSDNGRLLDDYSYWFWNWR